MASKEVLLMSNMLKLKEIYPFLETFFDQQPGELFKQEDLTLQQILLEMEESGSEDNVFDATLFVDQLQEFIQQMEAFTGVSSQSVDVLTILPGKDKSGNAETFDALHFRKSTITSIVGPTGSGKSRLLADIEWVAQADTPTARTILVNNEKPTVDWRFASGKKLVAQLSQNMNFVMDLSVREFLELHASSRMIAGAAEIVERIIHAANELAGEKFSGETPITSLSGGQSRALMIADTAMLSSSPVVLIDEIENAGIDRKKALQILTGEEKIVLMATHDPILALMADQRIVIKNGGIHRVVQTSAAEKNMLEGLEEADRKLQTLRTKLRAGESIVDQSF